jgi:hypothetical protein
MNFNSKLASSSLSFIDDNSNLPFKIDTDDKYGTLQFKTIDSDVGAKPVNTTIIFTIDSSASMNDATKDGKTKMDHSLFTMARIIESLCDSNINANIAINNFNDEVHRVLDFTLLTPDNKDRIIFDIKRIEPYGGTNMDAALLDVNERINAEIKINKSTKYIQIFMTDGEANGGRVDPVVLAGLVPSGVSNIFIGYGMNHDARMLSILGDSQHNGEYRFIDKIENSGLVYGEIIHNILYNLLDDPIITVVNGEIYNWKTNKWVNELNLSNISTNTKRDFHVKTHVSKMKQVVIKLLVKEDDENLCVGHVIPDENNNDDTLMRFAFKLKTQELLYEAREIAGNTFVTPSLFNNVPCRSNNNLKSDYIKTKLSAFMLKLNKYITSNDLSNNYMMKQLQDDIYVCYNSINTPYYDMYTIARQSSQGNQRAYSTSTNISSINCIKPTLTHQVAHGYINSVMNDTMLPHPQLKHYTGVPPPQLKRYYSDPPPQLKRYYSDPLVRSVPINKLAVNESLSINEDEIYGNPFKDYNLIQQNIVNTGNTKLNELMRHISG